MTASDALGQQTSQDQKVTSAAQPRMADPAAWAESRGRTHVVRPRSECHPTPPRTVML